MSLFLVRSIQWILATAPQGGLLATPDSRQRGSSPFGNPFIFYTAWERTLFISKFICPLTSGHTRHQRLRYFVIYKRAGHPALNLLQLRVIHT